MDLRQHWQSINTLQRCLPLLKILDVPSSLLNRVPIFYSKRDARAYNQLFINKLQNMHILLITRIVKCILHFGKITLHIESSMCKTEIESHANPNYPAHPIARNDINLYKEITKKS